MDEVKWRHKLGEPVYNPMCSPELDHYFNVRIRKSGAQLLIACLASLFRVPSQALSLPFCELVLTYHNDCY